MIPNSTVQFDHFRTDLPPGHRDWNTADEVRDLVRRASFRKEIKCHRKHGLPTVRAAVRCVIQHAGCEGEGWAFCSMSDNFVRKVGRRIAYGRAVKKLQEAAHAQPVS